MSEYDPIEDGHSDATFVACDVSISYHLIMSIPEMHVDRIVDEQGEDEARNYLKTVISQEHHRRFDSGGHVTVGIEYFKRKDDKYQVSAVLRS